MSYLNHYCNTLHIVVTLCYSLLKDTLLTLPSQAIYCHSRLRNTHQAYYNAMQSPKILALHCPHFLSAALLFPALRNISEFCTYLNPKMPEGNSDNRMANGTTKSIQKSSIKRNKFKQVKEDIFRTAMNSKAAQSNIGSNNLHLFHLLRPEHRAQ